MSDKSDESSVTWHEIINSQENASMPFFDLYREYADAVRQREAKKREAAYWPFLKV